MGEDSKANSVKNVPLRRLLEEIIDEFNYEVVIVRTIVPKD